jgi:hypothetical protein
MRLRIRGSSACGITVHHQNVGNDIDVLFPRQCCRLPIGHQGADDVEQIIDGVVIVVPSRL